MAEKYYTAEYTGDGFITHDDQEVDDLRFQICAFSEADCLTLVDYTDGGDTAASWASRVSGTEKTYSEAQSWGELVESEFDLDSFEVTRV